MNSPRIIRFGEEPASAPEGSETRGTIVDQAGTPAIDLTQMFATQVEANLPAVIPSSLPAAPSESTPTEAIVCAIPLDDGAEKAVSANVAKFPVATLRPEAVGNIGLAEQKALTDELLLILDKLSKADNQVLYEVAELFLKGKEGIDIKVIQGKIKKSQQDPGPIDKALRFVTRKTPAQVLRDLVDEINKVLRPQSMKLGQNMRAIEAQHKEKLKETADANTLLIQAGNTFLARVPVFAQMTHFLYGLHARAQEELARLEGVATDSQLPNDRHRVMQYRQVVDLLRDRAVALNTQYHDIEPTLASLTDIIAGNNFAISSSTTTFYTTFTKLLRKMIELHGTSTGLALQAGTDRLQEVTQEISAEVTTEKEELIIWAMQKAAAARLKEVGDLLAEIEETERLAQLKKETRAANELVYKDVEQKLQLAASKMPNIALLGAK